MQSFPFSKTDHAISAPLTTYTLDPGGLKAFTNLFRFRKNRQLRDSIMINQIARRLYAKDSLFFTTLFFSTVKLDSLFVKDTSSYGSILSGIQTLSLNISKIDSLRMRLQLLEAEDAINNLVEKIFPILKSQLDQGKNSAANVEQMARLRRIRWILAHGPVKDTVKINDTIKVFTIALKKRAEVFGYHSAWPKDDYLNYKFRLLSTLAFYGYELDAITGRPKSLHGWHTSPAITAAQEAGCKVALVITTTNPGDIVTFLSSKNKKARQTLIDSVAGLLKERQANGINLLFEGLNKTTRKSFVAFVERLSEALKKEDPLYEISMTLPANDKKGAYDITALLPFVDKFVLDFATKDSLGPLAPLRGSENGIEESINRYINQGIPTDRLIACLPYRGLLCDEEGLKEPRYLSYAQVKSEYNYAEAAYEEKCASMLLDQINGEGGRMQYLWFDNARTLNEKYDYILQNDVKGIGIWCLGYDAGHEELWNVLMDKVFIADTIRIDTLKIPPPKTFWAKIKKELYWYHMMLSRPCDVDRDEMKSDNAIGYITVGFAILLVLVSIFCMYKLKYEGDNWKWKKAGLRILIVLALLEFICIFLYFFLKKDFPLFGLSNSKEKCNPVPFPLIIMVISIGFLFGLFVMKFLITPLGRKDEPRP